MLFSPNTFFFFFSFKISKAVNVDRNYDLESYIQLWFRNPCTLTEGNIIEDMCIQWYTVAGNHEFSISKGVPVTILKIKKWER